MQGADGAASSSIWKAYGGLKKCLNYGHVEREYKQTNHPTQGPRKTSKYSLVSLRKEELRDFLPRGREGTGALMVFKLPIPMSSAA